MDGLLTPISTTYLKPKKDEGPLFTELKSSRSIPLEQPRLITVSSVDEALDALKGQPDYPTLVTILRFFTPEKPVRGSFNLHVPTPKSAAIVHQLVTEIAPNYWTLLLEGSVDPASDNDPTPTQDAELLLQCLRSVTGLNAILSHIKSLIQEFKRPQVSRRPDLPLFLGIFLDMLAELLRGDTSVQTLWESSIASLNDGALQKAQSQSLASVIAGGRLVSIVAEAATSIPKEQLRTESQWIVNPTEYTKWIGQNLASWTQAPMPELELHFCQNLLRQTMSLGYPGALLQVLIDQLLLQKGSDAERFRKICLSQSQLAKKILHMLLKHLSQRFLNHLHLVDTSPEPIVSAVAGVIEAVVTSNDISTNHLADWCTSASGAGLGDGIGIRRAVIAALAKNPVTLSTILEKSLVQFGDELYIKHAAVLQQEAHSQLLLLCAGYVQRSSPMKLKILLRSSTYLSTISNRIAATQVRTRFLGMIIGETLSELVNGKDKKLDFKMEELETEEAQWFKSLVHVVDNIGPPDAILSTKATLSSPNTISLPRSKPQLSKETKKKLKPEPKISTLKPRAIIEEVDTDEGEDEEEDLVPYAKGSDPEDSDDDATLVQRNKLKPPVYIRDLVSFLRDSESHEKQKLALQTSPVLIRRKANFGTEVSSHADELANLLVGIQDKFDIEGFDELKLQGLISLVVAQPKNMGPWFARTFFEGDYSLSQRTAILITLGLSARELAGFETSKYASDAAFPSKRLPEAMEKMYLASPSESDRLPASQLKALPATALESIANSITSAFLAPLAAKAADSTTGPDVLKLQSFTARYKSTVKDRPRFRAIPNTTASLLASCFFSPLTAHFQAALRSSKPVVMNPVLLSIYLQTLGIVIHSAGPSTLSLPQLTAELWDLLLSVRIHAAKDLSPLKGWLTAMAALLEVNEGNMQRLCESQGREVVDTREWVGHVFERTRGEDGGEENDVKMLAAGVLLRLGEAIEKYQALLMGNMIPFS